MNRFVDALLSACFVYFADGHEQDSDDARASIAKALDTADLSASDAAVDQAVERLTEFPR